MTEHPVLSAGGKEKHVVAFERIGAGQSPRSTLDVIEWLLKNGLIVFLHDKITGRDCLGPIKIPVYEVPIGVHMQWCKWCSENVPDLGCDYCLNDGKLLDGRCPKCDAEYK